jgi:ribonucleoside-triphosphate reductase
LKEVTVLLQVCKRDGRVVPYDKDRIIAAVYKAGATLEAAESTAEKVELDIRQGFGNTIPITEIEHLVDVVLCSNPSTEHIARSYSRYRNERTRVRERSSVLSKKIAEVMNFSSDSTKENANINGESTMGLIYRFASESSKDFSARELAPPQFMDAHSIGLIHIHDFDFYATGSQTCLQIDLKKLFKGGFGTGHGNLREPNSIGSYAALAAIVMQANQNEMHGGQSLPMFDFQMADGVRKSLKSNVKMFLNFWQNIDISHIPSDVFRLPKGGNFYDTELRDYLISVADYDNLYLDSVLNRAYEKTIKDTHQAMEGFIANLNTMQSRFGMQVPFTSINYGTDTSEEGRLVTKELLLCTEEGLGNGETPIFPVQIFKVKNGVNYEPNSPNYDLFKLAMKVSAKRMFPNFSFLDSSFNKPYYKEGRPETEVAYMGIMRV